ncbi:hypothetical protein CJ030_MR0G007450 [Morella rubra]|uniref:30S ribosomal protein S17, chloroplastic n=1 Tax=Morella rubra TaxID=262757 RepID=A0A6A1UML9_9ROSI|nr:hypothetical protein CJ030_MR0G007450 [Morella rubra]
MKQVVGMVVSNKMQKSGGGGGGAAVPQQSLQPLRQANLEVRLDPSRPLSKRKRWVVAEILKKARIYEPPSSGSGPPSPPSSTATSSSSS